VLGLSFTRRGLERLPALRASPFTVGFQFTTKFDERPSRQGAKDGVSASDRRSVRPDGRGRNPTHQAAPACALDKRIVEGSWTDLFAPRLPITAGNTKSIMVSIAELVVRALGLKNACGIIAFPEPNHQHPHTKPPAMLRQNAHRKLRAGFTAVPH